MTRQVARKSLLAAGLAGACSALALAPVATAEAPVRIHDIQGTTRVSEMAGEQVDGVSGVVTGVRSFGEAQGFWFQDPEPDDDPRTSEGLFVYTAEETPDVSVGDKVTVSGEVSEYYPESKDSPYQSTTQLTKASWKTDGQADVPAPEVLKPDTVPAKYTQEGELDTLELAPKKFALDFYESREAMNLQVNDARVVGPTDDYGAAWVTSKPEENPTERGGTAYTSYAGQNSGRLKIESLLPKEARRSVVWAIALIGMFYLFTLVLGYGAGAIVGPEAIKNAPGTSNAAAPLLAQALGGPVLMGFISAVAFATILAVVAGLTITASASFAHDIYANVIKKGKVDDKQAEVRVARITAVVIGAVAIVGGIFARNQNVAFLVALAFAIAASANLPTILYTLFWKRFNTKGALFSIYGGVIITITLIVFSPAVSGNEDAMLPNADFDLFPLQNPGLVSIPLSFFLGWLGTVLSKEHDEAKHAEMEVRALTGAGAEKATTH